MAEELSAEHQQILSFLDADSLLKVVAFLPQLGDRLERAAKFPVDGTVKALRNYPNNGLSALVYAMSPTAIGSIIRGTVAFDTAQSADGWYGTPMVEKAAGVYVVALRRSNDPEGKFLSEEQLLKVRDGIEQYIDACDILASDHCPCDPDDEDRIDWLVRVDGVYGKASRKESRCVTDVADTTSLRMLANNISRRCSDSPSDTPLTSSPLYVGCSNELSRRISAYDPDGPLTVNKPLVLFMSICKLYGFPVTPVVRVAIRTWKPRQLPLAEQLVAALADSFLFTRGFNACDTGGRRGDVVPQLRDTADLVHNHTSWFKANVQAAACDANQSAQFLNTLAQLEEDIQSEPTIPVIPKPSMTWPELKDRLEEEEREKIKELIKLQSKKKELDIIKEIINLLK